MFSEFFHKHPFIGLLLPFIGGILSQEFLVMPSGFFFYIPATILLLLVIVPTFEYFRRLRFLSIPGLILFLFFLGATRNAPKQTGLPVGVDCLISGSCTRILQPHQYLIKSDKHTFFLQLWNDTISRIRIGDQVEFTARVSPLVIQNDLYEFNYDRYLKQQGVDYKLVADTPPIVSGNAFSFYGCCQKIRDRLSEKIKRTVDDPLTFTLLQALCLGNRYDVENTTLELFRNTGTIHLLAVSGLHMGAIYLFLSFILRLLRIRKRYAELILIPLLWMFTGITGLSPSACRASAILSFIILGQVVRRDYVPLNAVAASAFFTLLISPHLLYSVSFQLSYAAYIGIILILPHLQVNKKQHLRFVHPVYSLFCVSLAAQIATAPLTAFYFHHFNLSSLLINIVAVPVATVLLYAGLVLLILPAIIGSALSFIPVLISRLLFDILTLFNKLPLRWDQLYPTVLQTAITYLFLLLSIAYLNLRKRFFLIALSFTLFVAVCLSLIHTRQQYRQQELLIYNRYRQTTVLFNYKGYYSFLKKSDSPESIPQYVKAKKLKPLAENEGFIGKDIQFADRRLSSPELSVYLPARGDSLCYPSDIVIITDNLYPGPWIKEGEGIGQIILDRSNSAGCVKNWQSWCSSREILFTFTGDSGNLIIPIP